ncbi:MAG: hypothetical protein A3C42_00435, partial [Chlamydiae bacterium RIFCSPHIGHO2_02_FULL_45_9]
MKILHLEASMGWGGQEIRILLEALGMRERGHTVIVAAMPGGELVYRARKEGFLVYEVNFRKSFWLISLWKLLWILWKHQIDIVNTHSSLDSWLGGIAARLGRRWILRTRHLSTPIKGGVNSRLLYGKLADFVVTTCAAMVPVIAKQSGKSLERIVSIATGVNPKNIHTNLRELEEFREKIGAAKEDFLVGTACVMRSWKGIDDLLMAAHLLRHISHLKWVIIGGGHAERHQKKAQELNLDAIVTFAGHLDPPYSAIRALDLFALLSTAHEGVSQAILQAAYLERPLLATSTGGLCEVCLHEKTGLIVPPLSPEHVAKAVLRMKHHPALRAQFGKEAHRLVLEKFTWDHTLDRMEQIGVYRKGSH